MSEASPQEQQLKQMLNDTCAHMGGKNTYLSVCLRVELSNVNVTAQCDSLTPARFRPPAVLLCFQSNRHLCVTNCHCSPHVPQATFAPLCYRLHVLSSSSSFASILSTSLPCHKMMSDSRLYEASPIVLIHVSCIMFLF